MELIQSFFQDEFLSKAFVLALLTGSLVYLKQVPKSIWSRIRRHIIFTVTIEQTDELFDYIDLWLAHKHSKKHRNVLAHINYRNHAIEDEYGHNEVTSPNKNSTKKQEKKKDVVKYRHKEDTLFLFIYGSFVTIRKGRDKLENAKELRSLFFDDYTITIFFYKNKIKKLLDEITEYNQQFKVINEKISIYISHWERWKKLRVLDSKKIGDIILKKEMKDKIINDFKLFEESKDWYITRSIPYRRGYLFYGSPGNGKTSMSLALANYFNKNIYTVTLSEVDSDNNLRSLFMNIPDNSILLIEDIDAAFSKRKTEDGRGITFSVLLNCLDGVYYKEGIITIMTTNHVEQLDNALIRDGRVDLRVEFVNPAQEQVKEYVELFYDIKLNGHVYDKDYSMSKIQNYCLSNNEKEITNKLLK